MPTVGQILKKVMERYPDLSSSELMYVMKEAVEVRGGHFENGFAKQDVINEERALELAASLRSCDS